MAAFLAFSAGAVSAQTEASKTSKPAATEQKACCKKGGTASKECDDKAKKECHDKAAAGKSSCCMKSKTEANSAESTDKSKKD